MECIYKLILLFGIFLPLISSRHVQFFRKDYTYIEEFDAFYKLHWDLNGLSWNSAFIACDNEGSTLFYPKLKGEWTLVKNLTENLLEVSNVTEIFVGVHDKFGVGEFVTVDGHPISSPLFVEEPDMSSDLPGGNCVLMNYKTGSYRVGPCQNHPYAPMPFVCKRIDDESCPTIDQGYKFIKASKKCYKVNRRQTVWDDAMRTCYMEGGVLTILENEGEAAALRDLLLVHTDSTYHVGIRRTNPLDAFYSVRGKKFDDLYQREYRNDDENINLNDCGEIYVSNSVIYTRSGDCANMLPFICELEANT